MGNKPISLIANWGIKRGKLIKAGKSFDVETQEEADELVACGAAHDPNAAADEVVVAPDIGGEGGAPVELNEEQRAAAILTVLQAMLEEDPKQENDMYWTKTKHPRNKTVDEKLDFDAVNEEVLAVFEGMAVGGHGD